jgi:hypothetical protein
MNSSLGGRIACGIDGGREFTCGYEYRLAPSPDNRLMIASVARSRGASVFTRVEGGSIVLAGLECLDLGKTYVRDASPLSALTGLRTLRLCHTHVEALSGLSGLVGLQDLDLAGTPVRDVATLAGLTSLEYLHLRRRGSTTSPRCRACRASGPLICDTPRSATSRLWRTCPDCGDSNTQTTRSQASVDRICDWNVSCAP